MIRTTHGRKAAQLPAQVRHGRPVPRSREFACSSTARRRAYELCLDWLTVNVGTLRYKRQNGLGRDVPNTASLSVGSVDRREIRREEQSTRQQLGGKAQFILLSSLHWWTPALVVFSTRESLGTEKIGAFPLSCACIMQFKALRPSPFEPGLHRNMKAKRAFWFLSSDTQRLVRSKGDYQTPDHSAPHGQPGKWNDFQSFHPASSTVLRRFSLGLPDGAPDE